MYCVGKEMWVPFHKPWTKGEVVVVMCFDLPHVSWTIFFFQTGFLYM